MGEVPKTQPGQAKDAPTPSTPADPGIIAERLQYLFETVRKPDGKKHTYREVLAGIEDAGGPSLSIGYLSQLVTGARANPMMDAITALAAFFKVPLAYFDATKDTTDTDEQLKLAAALQSAGVQDVAMRAVGLPEQSLKLVVDMIERLRQIEGLPDPKTPGRTKK